VIPSHIETATAQAAPDEEPSISGLHVLVVDDDVDARELVRLTLQSRGAVVQTASSSAEALDCVLRQAPDVVIADIGMPQEDGYELIRKLRTLENQLSRQRAPAIALTAYASIADRNQALAAGYDLHLTKPVEPDELRDAVANSRHA
ncbi:MAG: response regulator, partial [Acidobacteria bacterium]|nr:response regulator [Acidobacteriota bacterium]